MKTFGHLAGVLASLLGALGTRWFAALAQQLSSSRASSYVILGSSRELGCFWSGMEQEVGSARCLFSRAWDFLQGFSFLMKTTRKPFALITEGEPTWSPLKQATGALLSALEREEVNVCFQPKLVPNQSDC